ncbi:Trace amine-associated receptor 7c [Merluccius polli]|uniref:Trace amine-associated receptor 7c n=1 Tax=Merluccius polli TaxID=89951 RepID=A0AA47NCJ8_MERPO|nr:Trace amine-associated receptor 7c [Merluccius polli]
MCTPDKVQLKSFRLQKKRDPSGLFYHHGALVGPIRAVLPQGFSGRTNQGCSTTVVLWSDQSGLFWSDQSGLFYHSGALFSTPLQLWESATCNITHIMCRGAGLAPRAAAEAEIQNDFRPFSPKRGVLAEEYTTHSDTLWSIMAWMVYINSTLNPLIYALFYPWFRRAIRLIVTLRVFQDGSAQISVL